MAASVVFSYRSDTTTAWYHAGKVQPIFTGQRAPALTTSASAIGGSELYMSVGCMSIQDLHVNLLTSTFSILVRFKPDDVASRGLLNIGGPRCNLIRTGIQGGELWNYAWNDAGTQVLAAATATATTEMTTTTYFDFVQAFQLDTITGAITNYVNASQTATHNFSALWKIAGDPITGREVHSINIGHLETWSQFRGRINEIVIWNKKLSATTIAAMPLVSTAGVTSTGGLVGAARTDWVDVGRFFGGDWTSLTAAQIKTGVNQVQAGFTQTGTYDGADRWSTLPATDVRLGVSFTANNVGFTGSLSLPAAGDVVAGKTYGGVTGTLSLPSANQLRGGVTVYGVTGTYTWDTLAASDIRVGVNHIQHGVTFTGTLTPEVWSTIAANQIKFGVNQIQNSVTITGTYLWDTIPASNIRSGINHIQDGVTFTGSFAGELWSTIAASDIRSGVSQIQNSTTITGTLTVPTAVSGTAQTVNIGNIKEQIRYVLAQNNTLAGAEVTDLSGNMTRRVQSVFKYNPEKIPLNAHMLPAVYIFTDQKTLEAKTIAKDQVNAKREAELSFNIAGAVWNPLIVNQNEVDPADEDLEKLMENIERIIRSYSDLGSTVRWQFPEAVTYHSIPIDEQSHLRVSYMKLSCKVFY